MARSKSLILFLALLAGLTALFPRDVAQERSPFRAPVSRNERDLVITAVGDIMMPASIQNAAALNGNRYDLLFDRISADLRGDITFANLETPVDHKKETSGYPRFNARRELLTAMKKAGIGIVSTANNHALDAGPSGLRRTIDNIEAAGMLVTGTGRTRIEAQLAGQVSVKGVTAAFLAYTYGTNSGMPKKKKGMPYVNILRADSEDDLALAASAVRKARKTADLVLVSLHWSDEYRSEPTAWQRKAAVALIEAGADVILGHHPHVLQPVESYEARDGRLALIAYSLGNFISSQNNGVTEANRSHAKALRGDGIILSLFVRKRQGRTSITAVEFLPLWTVREQAGAAAIFRPVSIDRERARLETRTARTAEESKQLALLNYRRSVIVERLLGRP